MQFCLLFIVEIADVIQFSEVADIGEYQACICQVLVDVIEVCQKQLPPSIELVECLSDIAGHLYIGLVEVAYAFDGIGNGKSGMLTEEIGDRDIGRTPQGVSRHPSQCLIQEEGGSFVREDNCHIRHICAVLFEQVLCYVFKECHHNLKCPLHTMRCRD